MTIAKKDSKIEQAIAALRKLKESTDAEEAHIEADDILCEVLSHLGYDEVVDAYNDIEQWYS